MKFSGIDVFSGDPIEVRYDSVIQAVDPIIHVIEKPDEPVYIAPGWIDLQVNGYAGVDYNSPDTSHEEIARSIEVLHSTGTTRFYPTVITGSEEGMRESLRNVTKAAETLECGGAIEGFHVEGPHISAEDGPRGAHPQQHVRKPDIDEYRRWQDVTGGRVRLVTLSPEWPEATTYIETVVGDGVVVSIGHTRADGDQIRDAVKAGATMSTHIGNGAHSHLPRHPNYIWEQLAEDRLSAGLIVDGIHLGPAFVKVALRAKTVTRAFLVTDASMPALATPGIYRLGEQDVELTQDGRVILVSNGRLAGSALRMDDGISNLMRMTGISLPEAVSMATRNPARMGKIAGRQRGLAAGDRADFVMFHFDRAKKQISVVQTIVSGKEVYAA